MHRLENVIKYDASANSQSIFFRVDLNFSEES